MVNMMLDSYKIAFVVNIHNELEYHQTEKSLLSLIVPQNYKIEILTLREDNISAVYNKMMYSSDAKYKIYIQEGVEILNKNFLDDIIEIFKTNWNIGVIGMSGVKVIPTDGNILTAKQPIGKLAIKGLENIVLSSCEDGYEKSAAIDGYLMATQYDIKWRDDLFAVEGFYNTAQCIEFKRNYYITVVAGQKTPWVLCTNKKIIPMQDEKDKLLNEYSRDIYPLVSILIPTYNRSEYFEIALQSALMQTYRNIEIIVGDDSTDDKTKKIVQKYQRKYNNILYIKNIRRCNTAAERAYANYREILHRSHGEYINYLNDDDVFAPQKIEKMMDYYLQYPNVSLVTSYRKLIDKNGTEIFKKEIIESYKPLTVETDTLIKSSDALKMLIKAFNFIGEPTTALIRRCDIEGNLGTFAGKSFNCINDLPQWIQSLRHGDLIYMSDALSSMRIHSAQRSKDLFTQVVFKVEYMHIYLLSYQEKLINKEELMELLKNWLKIVEIDESVFSLLKQQKRAVFYDEDIIEEFLSLKKQAENIVEKLSK